MNPAKRLVLFAVMGAWTAAAPSPEELDLGRLREKQGELRRLQARFDAQSDQNRLLNRETKNLQGCLGQMEQILSAVRLSKPNIAAVDLSVWTNQKVQPLLEAALTDAQEWQRLEWGKKLDPSWGTFEELPDGKFAVKISRNAEGPRETVLKIGLPLGEVRGRRVRFSVEVKGEAIAVVAPGPNGGKFNLMVKTEGKTLWPDATIGGGTFD